jgi:shikimate 5-dehydrogenase
MIDGLEILVRQGAHSISIWTGSVPPLEPLREAVSD